MLISPEEAGITENVPTEYTDGACENMDPNTYDQMESIPVKFEKVCVSNSQAITSQKGVKRAKFATDSVDDPTARASNSDAVTKDEHSVFGDFIATELRNMKNDDCRRKLKRLLAKSVFDATEEDAAMTANCDE